MDSEVPQSATPILDLTKPFPTHEIGIATLLIGMALAIPLGLGLNYLLATSGIGEILLLFALLFVGVTIHELGHAVIAHLLKFRIQTISLGPVEISNEFGEWKIRFRSHEALGLTSANIDRIRRVRCRYILFALAGSSSNLLSGSIAALIGQLLPRTSEIYQLLVLFEFLSFFLALLSLIPFRSGPYRTDGYWLWTLFCSPKEIRRFLSISALHLSARQLSPKRWNQRWIRAAVTLSDISYECWCANWFAYISANVRKDEDAAARYLEKCLSLAGSCNRTMKELLPLEAAVFTAWFRRDRQKAAKWMERVNRSRHLPKLMQIRAKVALYCASESFTEAVTFWNEGLIYIRALPISTYRNLLEDSWIEWLREIEERRNSQAVLSSIS